MKTSIQSIVPTNSGLQVLSATEIEEVSGGMPFVAVVAAAGAFIGVLTAAESLGEKIGKAIYVATH